MSKPVDNIKYAVTKSVYLEYTHPYGECLLVVKETRAYVTVKGGKYGRGVDDIHVISRNNVLFFTDQDISMALKAANTLTEDAFNVLIANLRDLMKAMEHQYALPERPD